MSPRCFIPTYSNLGLTYLNSWVAKDSTEDPPLSSLTSDYYFLDQVPRYFSWTHVRAPPGPQSVEVKNMERAFFYVSGYIISKVGR